MFSLIWINGRVNNGEAGDLRYRSSHYDVIVMLSPNWVIIGSGNDMMPVLCQAITWTKADLLPIGSLETDASEIWIKIQ